jgi:hypothetical protein
MNFKRRNRFRSPHCKKFIFDLMSYGCGKNKRIFIQEMRPKHKNKMAG